MLWIKIVLVAIEITTTNQKLNLKKNQGLESPS